MTTTLGAMRTDLRSRLDEPSARLWADSELNTWLNEGLREVARRSETLLTFTSSIPIFPNVNKYLVPNDVIRIHRVEFQPLGATQTYVVQPSTYQEMDQVWGISQNSQFGSYPYYYVLWGIVPKLYMQIYPVPSQAGNLNLFYYRLPSTLAADSDIAEIPEGWYDLPILYAEYVALRKDRIAQWQEARSLFEEKLGNMIDITRQLHDQARTIMVGVNAVPEWLYGGVDY